MKSMVENLYLKLAATVFFRSQSEVDFERFQRYRTIDLVQRTALPLQIALIAQQIWLVEQLIMEGDEKQVLIDFLVAPSKAGLDAIQQALGLSCSREVAMMILLRERLLDHQGKESWFSSRDIEALVGQIMNHLSVLELLDWEDLTDKAFLSTHELSKSYGSFLGFSQVALNVYADNIGFDREGDQRALELVKAFLFEIISGEG